MNFSKAGSKILREGCRLVPTLKDLERIEGGHKTSQPQSRLTSRIYEGFEIFKTIRPLYFDDVLRSDTSEYGAPNLKWPLPSTGSRLAIDHPLTCPQDAPSIW